jgi:HK97 family phage major capsid protein/HK97 family phage prohead protease
MRLERLTIEVKFARGDAGLISGYASLFGRPADHVDDVVMSGVYRATLAAHKRAGTMPEMLLEHDGDPIGEWLEIEEDELGLRVKGRLDLDTEAGRTTYEALVAGEIDAMSIGYVAVKTGRDKDGARLLYQIDLREISLVKSPAASRARVLSVKHKEKSMTTATKQKTKAEGDLPADEPRSIEDRVGALETDVAALKQDVAAIRGTTEEASKSLTRIETKMNRPGGTRIDAKEVEANEKKAFATFLRTGDETEIKAAVSGSDPDGGYLILPTVDTSIRNLLDDVSPMRQLAEVVSINSSTYERFYSFGNRGAQWVGETTTRPQDTNRPELVKHSYGVMEMYAAPAGTRHMFEDASFDVAGWFNTWAANDFAVSEGEAFVRGDGTGGKPRGLYTYAIVATADTSRAWGEMQYLPAGHASAPTDDNWAKALVKTVLTLHPNYRANGAWLMSNATLIRIREIQDSNKRFMWSDHGNLSESAESGTLLGYPIHIDNSMDEIGENKFPIAFGDFKQGYVIVDRHGIRIVRDETTVKGSILLDTYKRVGGGLGDSRAIKWLKVATS